MAAAAHSPPKVMGVFDLSLFYIVTGVSLRWIATAAAAGPSSLVVWCGALLLFYLPLVFAVVELSSRYPQEGGLYVWTREAFGPFIGFMAGWSYFTSNLPYFPSVFYFDAGNALYIAGDHWLFLRHSATFFLLFALAALAFITFINIVGLKFGKWIHNIGALGMWLPALIVIILGFVSWRVFGSATKFTPAAMMPSFDLQHMIFWSPLIFALSGCEAASFMSGEIKDPERTIPRALPIAGAIIVGSYLIGTAAVLVAMPAAEVNTLQPDTGRRQSRGSPQPLLDSAASGPPDHAWQSWGGQRIPLLLCANPLRRRDRQDASPRLCARASKMGDAPYLHPGPGRAGRALLHSGPGRLNGERRL